MEQVTIRNLGRDAKSIYVKGRPITLTGYAEDIFSADIAQKFLDEHGPVVEKVDFTGTTVAADQTIPTTIWVANMSGNSWAPDKLRGRAYNKVTKVAEMMERDNPIKEIQTIETVFQGAEEIYTDDNGMGASRTLPTRTYTIPPYRRMELPTNVGEWLLQRDANKEPIYRRTLIKSRPPGFFEPSMAWSLDTIRSYLSWVKPELTPKDLGQTEAQIKKSAGVANSDKELHSAKVTLLRRLYYLLVDPAVRLPSKEEFDSFLAGNKEAASSKVTAEKAEALVNKAWQEANPTT